MVMVLIIGIFIIGTVITVWWITQPMLWSFVDQSEQYLITTGANTTGGTTTFIILKFASSIWGAVVVIAVMIWMVVSTQYEDWRGHHV